MLAQIPETFKQQQFQRPQSILESHWQEWLDSGVDPDIIAQNVCSIEDSWNLKECLNYKPRQRWKHPDSLVPGWLVRGVDLKGSVTLEGCQFKPDKPENPKQKYLSAHGYETSPLLLGSDAVDWQQVADDPTIPIVLTEGAKKAGAAISQGHACVSLPGVWNGQKKGRLHPLLKGFCGLGRTIYVCFDSDYRDKPGIRDAIRRMARLIAAEGAVPMVVNLPDVLTDGKTGIDDFIVARGGEAFSHLLEDAQTFEEWKDEIEASEPPQCRLAKEYRELQDLVGDRLRFNEYSQRIEIDGEPLELESLAVRLALQYNREFRHLKVVAPELAYQNSYSPVQEYLERVEEEHGSDTTIIDGFADRYWGQSAPIYQTFARKWLIGCVARALDPGCKMDTALILQSGEQGIKKSTFYDILSCGWFDDTIRNVGSENSIRQFRKAWIVEWGELEAIFRKKEVGHIKGFMSAKTDHLRPLYREAMQDIPRHTVVVGTTNEFEFLNDPSGARRFWVVPVKKNLDTERLQEERDRIWAAAVAMYRDGQEWWLTEEEKAMSQEIASDFTTSDPWQDPLDDWLEGRDECRVPEILSQFLNIDVSKQDKSTQMRVADCLRRSGWEKSSRYDREKQKKIKVWIRPKKVVQAVPDAQNLDPASISSGTTPENGVVPRQGVVQDGGTEIGTDVSVLPVPPLLKVVPKGGTAQGIETARVCIDTVPPAPPKWVKPKISANTLVYYKGSHPTIKSAVGDRPCTVTKISGDKAQISQSGKLRDQFVPINDLEAVPIPVSPLDSPQEGGLVVRDWGLMGTIARVHSDGSIRVKWRDKTSYDYAPADWLNMGIYQWDPTGVSHENA